MGNVIENKSEIFVLDAKVIEDLKIIASRHPLKRARICLHESLDNKTHEMIIVSHRDGTIPPHSHPVNKPESYHVLEGKLRVLIFNDNGSVRESFLLSSDIHPKMYRIKGGVWHQPVPMSEWVVYHEVATGPFNKEHDLIFLEER
jgi:cupin fold WbuC family metalloprotein